MRSLAPVTAESQPPAGDLLLRPRPGTTWPWLGLSRLRGSPADEHVAVLEEVHGQLRDILGELNESQP